MASCEAKLPTSEEAAVDNVAVDQCQLSSDQLSVHVDSAVSSDLSNSLPAAQVVLVECMSCHSFTSELLRFL